MKRVAFWAAILGLVGLGIFGVITYVPNPVAGFQLESDEGYTVVLEISWGGDTDSSQELSCDIWTAQFDCELRRGGNLGVVLTQTLPLAGSVAAVDPPDVGVIVTTTLTWDTTSLDLGPYESWCRLEETNGERTIYGYVEGEGSGDGNDYYLTSKFAIGEPCIIGRMWRGIATSNANP